VRDLRVDANIAPPPLTAGLDDALTTSSNGDGRKALRVSCTRYDGALGANWHARSAVESRTPDMGLERAKEHPMKHLIAISTIAFASFAALPAAHAQSLPPPLPALTAEQSEMVQQRMDEYRRITDARAARGDISADEAVRLMQWREWQIAQQVTNGGQAPAVAGAQPPIVSDSPPPVYYEERPRDYYPVAPAPVYVPYYRYPAPYYWGPRPYYWGASFCAGGFGHNFGGRICF
jgi:hypothetical protein